MTAISSGEPVRISICHCLACQRRTGSVPGSQARFHHDSVVISGRSSQFIRVGDEGYQITFHFCPDCGSTVYWEIAGQEDYITILVGAFADSSFPAPTISVYGSRKHEWVTVPPEAEHLA